MVFSSVSSFLDPPNWPQLQTNSNQQHQQQEGGSVINAHELLSHQLSPLPANPNPNHQHVAAAIVGGGSAPARLGGSSMAERARLAKMPQPEGPMKCPRCDSTNTKFCYYNNYSLSQPRHFCKTCRRYWTRGGALRNVPVGGGCRRNKKGKTGNTNKSSSSSSTNQNKQTVTADPSPTTVQLQTNSQFPFLPTLQNLSQLGNIGLNLAAINSNSQAHISLPNIGNSNSSSLMNELGFLHVGTGANTSGLMISNNNDNNILTSSQFALFDPTTSGLYTFQSEGNMGNNTIALSSSSASMAAARVSQMAPVKMEETHLVNLSRPVPGLTSPANNQSNHQYWTGSGFLSSSSNDHLL